MTSLVSVIVPVYNEAGYIRSTLHALINQDYLNLEIIVVDDGSIDDTFPIVKEMKSRYPDKIKLYRLKKRESKSILVAKSYFARKFGYEKSLGKYILEFSGHIIVPKDFVSTYVENLEKSDVDMVGCRIYCSGGMLARILFYAWMLSGSAYYPMFKRSKINRYPSGDDAELNLKLKTYITPKTFVIYKKHSVKRFLRRMINYGNARAWLMKKYGARMQLKYLIFAIVSLVLGYGIGFFLGLFGIDVRKRFGW